MGDDHIVYAHRFQGILLFLLALILFQSFSWIKSRQESNTLWISDLDPNWDEKYLEQFFEKETLTSIKIQRDQKALATGTSLFT